MRVLICGSRDWTAKGPIEDMLDGMLYRFGSLTVVSGMARGADRIAADWAGERGEHLLACPADWEAHGKAAGPIRNRLMLEEGQPDVVYAFKDGFDWAMKKGGTEHMVSISKAAGVPVFVVGRP